METTTWICDTCGNEIEKAGDGWVEWLSTKDTSGKSQGNGLRLVHHRTTREGCQYGFADLSEKTILQDLELAKLLGADGLNLLISMIADRELPTEELLEMIKRLHIPGYEHARKHFSRAITEAIIDPNLPPGYYWQYEIKAVLEAVENGEL